MTANPEFDSLLDDALDDFRLVAEGGSIDKPSKRLLLNGLNKMAKHIQGLEARIVDLEAR